VLAPQLSLQTTLDVLRITLLEKESITDPLTGVFNRRYMEQRLRKEIAKAQRYDFDLSLMLKTLQSAYENVQHLMDFIQRLIVLQRA